MIVYQDSLKQTKREPITNGDDYTTYIDTIALGAEADNLMTFIVLSHNWNMLHCYAHGSHENKYSSITTLHIKRTKGR